MRAAVSIVLALVLGRSPAAQAQVVSGRAAALPVGGLGLAPLSTPSLTAPTLSPSALGAPGLGSTLAVPSLAPVPSAVMAARLAAVQPVRAARALLPVRAAPAAPLPAAPTPEKALAVQERFDELRAAFDEKEAEAPVAVAERRTSRPSRRARRARGPGSASPSRWPSSWWR
ncbi:MAG: hypothetical protein HYX59_10095 [Elusimicrobia bacterium]|nr:hypothetical protein [Elusimicrobiota bacterium]